MNLDKYIQEVLTEFEKRFVKKATNWRENNGWAVDYVDSRADNLKSFLSQKLRDISVKVAEECFQPELKGDFDAKTFKDVKAGFDLAISQMRENINKLKE